MRLALFQPDIPQNLGAAIRLTACLGLGLDVIEPCGFPLSDRAIRRAAMDYADGAEVRRHDSWTSFLAARGGARLLLLTTRGAQAYERFGYRPDDILLVGRESAGAPEAVHAAADARLCIPMAAGARSLNVVVAAAMALGEGLRQTGGFPTPAEAQTPFSPSTGGAMKRR
jgi:tRNA (cytidine/uridine-2'-O-)-methyltransferase